MMPAGKLLSGSLVTALTCCGAAATPAAATIAKHSYQSPPTARRDYAWLASSAVGVLKHSYYTGTGKWNMCVPAICARRNFDWGADSLTYALFFRWKLTRDRRVTPIMRALARTAHQFKLSDRGWSDVPMWDSVADLREYEVTRSAAALAKAKTAFRVVDSVHKSTFAAGACPSIDYQRPDGGRNDLKTIETDSNYIKAALLLYQATRSREYLTKAEQKYAAVRTYFLSERYPLYTAYVFDTGSHCNQRVGEYFASGNGNMIWAGERLAQITGDAQYADQAVATALAVSHYLCDSAGIFTDPQVENDVVEPLIEAMYLLATAGHQQFARGWLLRQAAAAAAARTARGTYGRIFDGPAPPAPVTAWQANGGIALMIAAAKLDPRGVPADPGYWRNAVLIRHEARLPAGGRGTVRLSFSGRAIAIVGTLGERCCKPGHARVFLDGSITVNRMGIWQGLYSGGGMLGRSVLFAWRWPAAGPHTIAIAPSVYGMNRGSTFFHMTGYYLVR